VATSACRASGLHPQQINIPIIIILQMISTLIVIAIVQQNFQCELHSLFSKV
jgi:hypothetical protein